MTRQPAVAVLLVALAAAGSALAQTPQPTVFASASDIAALSAKADREHPAGTPNFVQPIASLSPYVMNLEHRTGVGPAAVHEAEAELFYVVEGSGTLVTGGKLAGERRTNPQNLTGTGVEGGQSRRVAKGDLFFVPEGSPHWFSAIDGKLVLMSLHLPRGGQ